MDNITNGKFKTVWENWINGNRTLVKRTIQAQDKTFILDMILWGFHNLDKEQERIVIEVKEMCKGV